MMHFLPPLHSTAPRTKLDFRGDFPLQSSFTESFLRSAQWPAGLPRGEGGAKPLSGAVLHNHRPCHYLWLAQPMTSREDPWFRIRGGNRVPPSCIVSSCLFDAVIHVDNGDQGRPVSSNQWRGRMSTLTLTLTLTLENPMTEKSNSRLLYAVI